MPNSSKSAPKRQYPRDRSGNGGAGSHAVAPADRDSGFRKARYEDHMPDAVARALMVLKYSVPPDVRASSAVEWSRLYGRLKVSFAAQSRANGIALAGDGYCVQRALLGAGMHWVDAPAVCSLHDLVRFAMTADLNFNIKIRGTNEKIASYWQSGCSCAITFSCNEELDHCFDVSVESGVPQAIVCCGHDLGPRTGTLVFHDPCALDIYLAADQAAKGPSAKRNRRKRANQAMSVLSNETSDNASSSSNPNAAMMQSLKKLQSEVSKLQAGNAKSDKESWKAANFTAAPLPSELLAAAEGTYVPCSTSEEAIERLGSVLTGQCAPPKRFGCDSVMQHAVASKIISLTGMTAGNTVIVTAPLLAAHKGCLVFEMDPAGTTANVLGYVAPDKDVESYSSRSAVSFAELDVMAPLVVGGSTVTIGQMTVESGLCEICPLSSHPGKLAPICFGRHAPHRILSAKPVSVAAFTAHRADSDVVRFSPIDPQDSALVKMPSVDKQQDEGCLISTGSRMTRFVASDPLDTDTSLSQGFLSAFGAGGSYSLTTTKTTIWGLHSSNAWLRHMWYGHFTMLFSFRVDPPTTNADGGIITLNVVYSDGSSVSKAFDFDTPDNKKDYVTLSFNSHGHSDFSSKAGLYITSFRLQGEKKTGGTVPIERPSIDVTFEDIAYDTEYITHVITGAVQQANLSVSMHCYTEVFPEVTGVTGKFIEPTPDLPYSTPHFPDAVRAFQSRYQFVWGGDDNLYQANWFKKLKSVAGFAKPWGKAGANLLKGSADPRLQAAGHVLDATNRSFTSTNFRATGFGHGARDSTRSTGIAFPGIRGPELKVFEVATGNGRAPLFVRSITNQRLHAEGPWEGESADLAFLLAALAAEGWPIASDPRSPMLVSGDISNLRTYGQEQLTFTLHPVDDVAEKAQSRMDNQFLVAVEGVWVDSNPPASTKLPIHLLFGPGVTATVERTDATPLLEGQKHTIESAGSWDVALSFAN